MPRRRKATPKKFKVTDDIPEEKSGDDIPVNEDELNSEESEEDNSSYEESEEEDVAPKKPRTNASAKPPKREDDDAGRRYFKILIESIKPETNSPPVQEDKLSASGGRYTGKNPMQAAKKAFTRICRVSVGGGECTYIFSIQETTQSSAKKVFTYRGVRRELDTPQKVTKGDVSYSIRFNSEVRSYKPGGTTKVTPPAKKTAGRGRARRGRRKR
ncbi:MAG: hypothetical protein R3213_09890 [Flavobacteriaceae bacterium]|nr:hypothetical protein [Flavobacteriaceae bacterium]